jgi:hypothetical protein
MKIKNAYIHRGHVLRDAVEATGLNKEIVADKAGYTRSSYYKHIQDPDLAYHILVAYGKAIKHDFTVELHGMPKYIVEDPPAEYEKGMSIEYALKQIHYWKDKYLELLEKYNQLIEEKITRK